MGSKIISPKLKSGSKREKASLITGFDDDNIVQRELKRYMAQLSGLVATRVRELENFIIRLYLDHTLEAIAGISHAAGESQSSIHLPLAVISSGPNLAHGNRVESCCTYLQVDPICFIPFPVSPFCEHCAVPACVELIGNQLRTPTKHLPLFGARYFGTVGFNHLSMHGGRWPRGKYSILQPTRRSVRPIDHC